MIEHKTGSYFLYEAVSGHPYRPTPGFDRLRVILVPEESTRVAMLKRGEVDLADIGFDSAKEILASGNQVLDVPNSIVVFVSFLGTWEERAKTLNRATAIRNVRKALATAIDRENCLSSWPWQGPANPRISRRSRRVSAGMKRGQETTRHPMIPRKLSAARRGGYPDGSK